MNAIPLNTFPELEIFGSADDLGYQHGHQLASQIEDTIEFYARLFGRKQQDIFAMAKHFQRVIGGFKPEYTTEIEALAAAAQINPSWIYALNARSEILNSLALECTAVFFQRTGLLGQNWDWSQYMERLVRLVTLKPASGPVIKMLTEPGIIGKIGMNSEGLGVCLNILSCAKPTRGVPIHILLRSILDSGDLREVRTWIERAGAGRASNIMLGFENGESLDIEFAGDEQFELPRVAVQLHTNHYFGGQVAAGGLQLESSLTRYQRAEAMAAGLIEHDLEEMKGLLTDQSAAEASICSHYHAHELLGNCGTVCTLIMDLKSCQMHLKRGNNSDGSFTCYSL